MRIPSLVVVSVALVCVLAFATTASAQDPTGPAPKSSTITTTAVAGGGYKSVTETVPATGAPIKSEVTWMFDGKPHPVTGNPKSTSQTYTKGDATHHTVASAIGDKPSVSAKVTMAADGKARSRPRRTCAGAAPTRTVCGTIPAIMIRRASYGALLVACSAVVLAQNPRQQVTAGAEPFSQRVLATGLENPWTLAWGPDNHLWVTERTGFRVTRIDPASGAKRVALVLDDVYQASVQDGLMGLAFHPEFLRGKSLDYVYVAYTYDADPGGGVTRRMRIRRFTYDAPRQILTTPTDVIQDLPAHDDHGGGRLVVGPDAKLYLTRGDQGANFLANYCNVNRAQDLPTREQVQARNWIDYQGKILRLNLDGSIPADNPILGGVRSHIYTYGHRNPQGLAFGPNGRLYASEHGPSTDDEVNLIIAGKNYGWPRVAGFRDDQAYVWANWSASAPTPCPTLKFNSRVIPPTVPQATETSWEHRDFAAPLATFFTVPATYDLAAHGNATIAPAGIATYTASTIPGWANSILVTGMRTGAVYRLKLGADGTSVSGAPVQYFKANDRHRDVAISPDGRRVFLVTDSFGATADDQGQRTEALANPGALVEFTYIGSL